jgi:predicted DNA-binding protein YlxM (UPF0122 family)
MEHLRNSEAPATIAMGEPNLNVAPCDETTNPGHPATHDDLQAQGSPRAATACGELDAKVAFPSSPQFSALSELLQASRAELTGFLAKAQELQRQSWQCSQGLLEEIHVRLHEELEAAVLGAVEGARQHLQQDVARALEAGRKEAAALQVALVEDAQAQWQASRQYIVQSLKEGAEKYQKVLGELSTSALQDFQRHGEALLNRYQMRLEKSYEDLKKKGLGELAEHMQGTQSELASELRRHAKVEFEVFNERLQSSGRAVAEETQKQADTLSAGALATLREEAGATTQRGIAAGAEALQEAAEQAEASLAGTFQKSLEEFEKRVGELTEGALAGYRQTSESFLQNLQQRLDHASRALQLMAPEAGSSNPIPSGD